MVQKTTTTQPFLRKTREILDDTTNSPIVSWNASGDSFIVWQPAEFARDILPTYFKHNNFSSFVRQLNTYGFRKVESDRWEFANEGFKRDDVGLMNSIQRRKPAASTTPTEGHTRHHRHHHHTRPPQAPGDTSSNAGCREGDPGPLTLDNAALQGYNRQLSMPASLPPSLGRVSYLGPLLSSLDTGQIAGVAGGSGRGQGVGTPSGDQSNQPGFPLLGLPGPLPGGPLHSAAAGLLHSVTGAGGLPFPAPVLPGQPTGPVGGAPLVRSEFSAFSKPLAALKPGTAPAAPAPQQHASGGGIAGVGSLASALLDAVALASGGRNNDAGAGGSGGSGPATIVGGGSRSLSSNEASSSMDLVPSPVLRPGHPLAAVGGPAGGVASGSQGEGGAGGSLPLPGPLDPALAAQLPGHADLALLHAIQESNSRLTSLVSEITRPVAQVLAALQSGNLAVMSASGGPSTSSQLGIRPLHDSSQLGIRPLHDPTLRSTGPAPATVWPTASDDPTQQQPVDGPLSGMQQLALAAASVGGAVTPGAHAPQVPVLPWPQHFTQMPFTAGVGGPISAAKREQQSSDTPLEMSGGTGTGQTRSHSHSQGGSRGAAGSGGSADGGAGPSRGGARGARQARHDPHLATALEGSLLAPDFARAAAVGASGDVVMGSDGPRSEDPDAAGGGDEGGGGGSGSGGMSDDSSGRAFKRSRDTGRAMQPGGTEARGQAQPAAGAPGPLAPLAVRAIPHAVHGIVQQLLSEMVGQLGRLAGMAADVQGLKEDQLQRSRVVPALEAPVNPPGSDKETQADGAAHGTANDSGAADAAAAPSDARVQNLETRLLVHERETAIQRQINEALLMRIINMETLLAAQRGAYAQGGHAGVIAPAAGAPPPGNPPTTDNPNAATAMDQG